MSRAAMGSRKDRRSAMFVSAEELPQGPAAPIYAALNALLAEVVLDAHSKQHCRPF